MMPVEELTLKTASLTDVLDWLTQPQDPHLVDGTSTKNPLTALAILITPEALYDPNSPMVGLGLVYKAPYIQAASWSEAYFDLKLASQAEASNRTSEAKVIFVQIQAALPRLPNNPSKRLGKKLLSRGLSAARPTRTSRTTSGCLRGSLHSN